MFVWGEGTTWWRTHTTGDVNMSSMRAAWTSGGNASGEPRGGHRGSVCKWRHVHEFAEYVCVDGDGKDE